MISSYNSKYRETRIFWSVHLASSDAEFAVQALVLKDHRMLFSMKEFALAMNMFELWGLNLLSDMHS